MMVVGLFSCEDPTTLPVSKVFNGNRLGTIYVDTFSVMTSTVQLDSMLTNGTGTMLLGKYHDEALGDLNASTYFQLSYVPYGSSGSGGTFLPDIRSRFDSVALIMHYDHNYAGDTTKPVTINMYQLSELMNVRSLPNVPAYEVKIPVSPMGGVAGFYNNTEFQHYPDPIFSATVKFQPHTDSLYIKLPKSFGANWFRLAQVDSFNLFSDANKFIAYYFYGVHMNVDAPANAAVVGFKTGNMKIRFYYRQLLGDLYVPARFDFHVTNPGYQFNHIDYDRSGTAFASVPKLTPVPTAVTGNTGFVQSGTGLVTRLDFPSLKGFFALNSGIVLSAAELDIYPIQGTYSNITLQPNLLTLYPTDGSSLPIGSPSTIGLGTSQIHYDLEYGNTYYSFSMFNFLFAQLKANTNYVTPLILAPPVSQGSSVQRLYYGDRFKIGNYQNGNKIKLRIYYTSTLN
jgi:hypothetical protein